MSFTITLGSGVSRTVPDSGSIALGRGLTSEAIRALGVELVKLSDVSQLSGCAVTLSDLAPGVRIRSTQKSSAGQVIIMWNDERTPIDLADGGEVVVDSAEFVVRLQLRVDGALATNLNVRVSRTSPVARVTPTAPHDDTETGRGKWFGIEGAPAWAQLCAACIYANKKASPLTPQKRIAVRAFNALRVENDLNAHARFNRVRAAAVEELSLGGNPSLQQIAWRSIELGLFDDADLQIIEQVVGWREGGGAPDLAYGQEV